MSTYNFTTNPYVPAGQGMYANNYFSPYQSGMNQRQLISTQNQGLGGIHETPLGTNAVMRDTGMTNVPQTGGGLLGMGAQGWGTAINGFSALSNAYFGHQMLDQTKKQNKIAEQYAGANLYNTAQGFNSALENRAENRAFIRHGSTDSPEAQSYKTDYFDTYKAREKV
jgi:hypothetical protein